MVAGTGSFLPGDMHGTGRMLKIFLSQWLKDSHQKYPTVGCAVSAFPCLHLQSYRFFPTIDVLHVFVVMCSARLSYSILEAKQSRAAPFQLEGKVSSAAVGFIKPSTQWRHANQFPSRGRSGVSLTNPHKTTVPKISKGLGEVPILATYFSILVDNVSILCVPITFEHPCPLLNYYYYYVLLVLNNIPKP